MNMLLHKSKPVNVTQLQWIEIQFKSHLQNEYKYSQKIVA